MKIDIAICTWNRARFLSDTLRSIRQAVIPDGVTARILVVDNNSTDGTAACVQSFESQLNDPSPGAPHLSVLLTHEARQGHTYSRNRAIAVADGDLMLWTDDDVIVDTNWIASYVQASTNQDVVFWGGMIIPKFESEIPAWIDQNWDTLKGCFAARDLGSEAFELDHDHLPYGANFAVRTSVQKQFLFNEELGRRNNGVLGEDEIEMFDRLLREGYHGSWVPDSSLFHRIGADRASESYVRNYFIGQGRVLRAKGNAWSTSSRKLYWQSIFEFAAYRFKRHWGKSPNWVAHLVRSGLAEGQYLTCQTD